MRSDLASLSDDRVSSLLSAMVEGGEGLDPELVRRLEHDLRFQAELVQYRKLRRGLAALADEALDPPEGLDELVLARLDEAERAGILAALTGRRVAYLGGLAAATAAGVGTALVLARRRAA